jgi:hypothetical protein
MPNAQQLFVASRTQRKTLILGAAGDLDCDEIERSRRISRVLNTFLPDYFDLQIAADLQQAGGSILDPDNLNAAIAGEIDRFTVVAVEALHDAVPNEAELVNSSLNIYEMTGAVKLTFANKVTRTLNTKMGLLWERIANISPFAINPESEFDIAVKGIDLVARNFHTDVIEYQ